MKITRITAHQVDLPLIEGSYSWSSGKSIRAYDSTVVRVETDVGLVGHGEVCPLGPAYLPAYAAGVRAGLAELAPHLIGCDPRDIGVVNRLMDERMKGHPYVKSPLDMACWDLLGLATRHLRVDPARRSPGRGGRNAIARSRRNHPQRMAARVAAYRAEGFRQFQIKVGSDPALDIERIRSVASGPATRRAPGRRCQYQLAAAPGGAGDAGDRRHRALCRAAVPRLTRPTSTSGGARRGRSSSTKRSTASPFCCAPTPTGPWTSSTSSSARSAGLRLRGRCAMCASRSASR